MVRVRPCAARKVNALPIILAFLTTQWGIIAWRAGLRMLTSRYSSSSSCCSRSSSHIPDDVRCKNGFTCHRPFPPELLSQQEDDRRGPAYLRVPPLARLLFVKNGCEVNTRGTLSKNMVWVSGCLPLQHWEKNLLLGPNRVLPGRVNACASASTAIFLPASLHWRCSRCRCIRRR